MQKKNGKPVLIDVARWSFDLTRLAVPAAFSFMERFRMGPLV